MVSFYLQYGFSQWKRHGNHSRVEKDTGFIIVMKMKSLKGQAVKSFHIPFSESGCHLSTVADVVIPYGGDLSHVLDHSYSTHCPISTSSEA